MINFNVPPFSGKEIDYIQTAIKNQKICGDGQFTKKCSEWIEKRFLTKKSTADDLLYPRFGNDGFVVRHKGRG